MEKSTLKIQIKDYISEEYRTVVNCSDIPCSVNFNNSNGEIDKNYYGVDINIDIPKISK